MYIWICFAPIIIRDDRESIPSVGKRCYTISTGIDVGFVCCIDEERYIFIALEEKRKVETFIACRHSETVLDFRNGRIAHRNSIIIVNDTVSIDILVFDITSHIFTEILFW